METGLRGARVLVTASSRGIGFGIAEGFVAEGARVVLNSSNATRLEAAVARLRPRGDVRGILGDLSRREDLDRLVDGTLSHLGGIDTLVYVTGSPRPGVYLEQGYEEWEAAAQLLVVSPAFLARRVADAMIQSGTRGRMVFLTSISVREPIPTIATSSVLRIAVAGLVRTLAREIGPKGIRVNGILPGFVKTDRIDEVMKDTARRRGSTPEQAMAETTQAIPLGRFGTVEEIAKAAIFLGSDLSSYVSGTMLAVDGALLRSVG